MQPPNRKELPPTCFVTARKLHSHTRLSLPYTEADHVTNSDMLLLDSVNVASPRNRQVAL